jgi:hypothetical protein
MKLRLNVICFICEIVETVGCHVSDYEDNILEENINLYSFSLKWFIVQKMGI